MYCWIQPELLLKNFPENTSKLEVKNPDVDFVKNRVKVESLAEKERNPDADADAAEVAAVKSIHLIPG